MTDNTQRTQSVRCIRATITIPAAAGTARTILDLSGDTTHSFIGCKILKKDTSGSDRAAFSAGDSTSNLPQYVVAGEEYYEPGYRDQAYTYIKAASGAAIANVCVVLYSTTE